MLSKLLKVTIKFALHSNPPSKDLLQKMLLWKLSSLHMLFLQNKAQIKENNYEMMLFMSKQVSLPRMSLILQKMKIGFKSDIRPFCMKSFN